MTTPDAVAASKAIWAMNVTDLLPAIAVPTLVMHQRDESIPLEIARRMAAAIPGARLAVLDGRNHILLANPPATRQFLDELEAFLAD